MIGVSDRVVSKWETGKSILDTSLLQSLCDALGISINELFAAKYEPIKLEEIAIVKRYYKFNNGR